MEKPERYRIKILFWVASIFLLLLSVFSYLKINGLFELSGSINHTNLVRLALENIFSGLKEAESGKRGYVLTNDPIFLEHFQKANQDIVSNLFRLDSLTKDNSEQQRNILVLQRLVAREVDYLKSTIDDAPIIKITASRLLAGEAIMEDVRRQIVKMALIEEKLLKERNSSLITESSLPPFAVFSLTITAVIILVVSYYKIMQELRLSNRLESDLEKQNHLLEDRNESLAKMNKELEAFTYISGHDLQEPLRKIQIFANRLLDNETPHLSDKGVHSLNRIRESANRMQALIKDLLVYSRTQSEEFTFESTSLNDIIEEVKKELAEEINQKNAIIDTENLGEAYVVATQFYQLMHNLIGNALKFSRSQIPPHITIKGSVVGGNQLHDKYPTLALFSAEKSYYRLVISDNGIGFEPQYKDLIFKVFQRLHDRDRYPGTGIGLAIVKKIVDNHKGFITATSEPDRGTTFAIFLPEPTFSE
ncbi:MAG: CHASE3 domain-containing protein [Spirosomataceae bacterium]